MNPTFKQSQPTLWNDPGTKAERNFYNRRFWAMLRDGDLNQAYIQNDRMTEFDAQKKSQVEYPDGLALAVSAQGDYRFFQESLEGAR